jgi:hypothetical protein
VRSHFWGWLKSRGAGVADEIIASLVIAGLTIVFLRRPPTLFVLAAAALAISIVVAIILLRRGAASASDLRHIERTKVGESLDLGHLAMEMAWRSNQLDKTHHFDFIEERYEVVGTNGKFSYHYRGTNVSRSSSLGIREVICGDAPVETTRMNVQARDLARGRPITPKVVTDKPYMKVFDLVFPQPVPPGEQFEICWSCEWPGTFTRVDDYVFFTSWARLRGVSHFVGTLVLAVPPRFVVASRYYGRHTRTELGQPEIVERNGLIEVTLEMNDPPLPKGYIYQLEFGRGDIP